MDTSYTLVLVSCVVLQRRKVSLGPTRTVGRSIERDVGNKDATGRGSWLGFNRVEERVCFLVAGCQRRPSHANRIQCNDGMIGNVYDCIQSPKSLDISIVCILHHYDNRLIYRQRNVYKSCLSFQSQCRDCQAHRCSMWGESI
jgi:hypothetical protein